MALKWRLLPALALIVAGAFPNLAQARESSCPEIIKRQNPPEAGEEGLVPGKTVTPGKLRPVSLSGAEQDKATLTMDFGADRERDIRTQTYRVAGVDPSKVRVISINDFVSGNTPLPIGNEQMTYRAGASEVGRRNLVNVRVCYDPGGPREPDPGRYVGSLLVVAPNAESLLTVEMTFRDNNLFAVIVALLLGIVAGVVLQAVAIRQQAPKDKRPQAFLAYLANFRILLALGGGVVAAIGAYSKLVAGDPTWDGSVASLFSLTTATFGATVVTKAAIDLKGPTEAEKREGLAR